MLVNVNPRGRVKKHAATTAKIRASLQSLVDGEIENVALWLKQTANGVPKVDQDGKPIVDQQGSFVWVNKPDPGAAVKLIGELAEFVIPKLSRAEQHIVAQVESSASIPMVERVGRMTTSEIKALLAQSVEDVPHRVVEQEPLPSWLQPPEDR